METTEELRNLSPDQRAMVGARMKREFLNGRGRRMNPRQLSPEFQRIAESVGVTKQMLTNATRLLNHGIPELIEAVDEGRVAASTACRCSSLSIDDQLALARTDGSRAHTRQRAEVPIGEANEKQRETAVRLANEAINCLIRIPKNNPYRSRGFQIVVDWVKHNK